MDIGKDREIGLFAKKIYTGHLFAEKTYDDFYEEIAAKQGKMTDEEIEKAADKAFVNYLDVERMKEYVYMREPTTDEARSMQEPEISQEILSKLEPDAQVVRAEQKAIKDKEKEKEIMELVLNCIIGSSFTDSGVPAKIEKVRETYKKSTRAMGYITGEWMEGLGNFQKKSGRASRG